MADPLAAIFEQAGYTLTQDSKGRCYSGIWKLINGDLALLRSLRDEPLLRLLRNAQWRKGKAFTYRELLGLARPGSADNLTRLNVRLYALLDHQLVLRGYTVQCPICDLESWYDPASIAANTCQGCRSPLALPLDLTFAYRLNRLFQEGLKQGALTVLLTLLHYMEHTTGDLIWEAGYTLRKDGLTADIDLVIHDKMGLHLIECKDNLPVGDLLPESETVIAQLEANRHIAGQVNAAEVVLATLCEPVPEKLRNALPSTGTIPLRLLTRNDLLHIE